MLPLCDHCGHQSFHLDDGLCLVCRSYSLESEAVVVSSLHQFTNKEKTLQGASLEPIERDSV